MAGLADKNGLELSHLRCAVTQVPSLESLYLPVILAPLAERRQGFVLFTRRFWRCL